MTAKDRFIASFLRFFAYLSLFSAGAFFQMAKNQALGLIGIRFGQAPAWGVALEFGLSAASLLAAVWCLMKVRHNGFMSEKAEASSTTPQIVSE